MKTYLLWANLDDIILSYVCLKDGLANKSYQLVGLYKSTRIDSIDLPSLIKKFNDGFCLVRIAHTMFLKMWEI